MSSGKRFEHEQQVLACVIGHGDDSRDAYTELSKLCQEADFKCPEHQLIYRALGHLFGDREKRITMLSVIKTVREFYAKDREEWQHDPVKLRATIQDMGKMGIAGCAPDTLRGFAGDLLSICQEEQLGVWMKRAIEMRTDGQAPETVAAFVREQAEAQIARGSGSGSTSQVDAIKALIQDQMEVWDGKRDTPLISTGWSALDKRLGGGWRTGKVHVVAARSGMGKSSLWEQWAVDAARKGRGVLVCPLEMGTETHLTRMIKRRSAFEFSRHGMMDYDRKRIMESRLRNVFVRGALELAELPMQWVDTPHAFEINALISQLEACLHRGDVNGRRYRAVVIDYFQQLTDGSVHASTSRHRELSLCLAKLLTLAARHGVAVILICQCNRAIEGNGKDVRLPRLSDLGDCGDLERYAHSITFPHRAHIISPGAEKELYSLGGAIQDSEGMERLQVVVVKSRDGGTGVVDGWWEGVSKTFTLVDHPEEALRKWRSTISG